MRRVPLSARFRQTLRLEFKLADLGCASAGVPAWGSAARAGLAQDRPRPKAKADAVAIGFTPIFILPTPLPHRSADTVSTTSP